MHPNLYLVETLDRQHREEYIAEAAGNRTAAQVSNMQPTRSQTMKRIKLIAATILVAATLVGAGPHAFTAEHSTVPTVASMCCFYR